MDLLLEIRNLIILHYHLSLSNNAQMWMMSQSYVASSSIIQNTQCVDTYNVPTRKHTRNLQCQKIQAPAFMISKTLFWPTCDVTATQFYLYTNECIYLHHDEINFTFTKAYILLPESKSASFKIALCNLFSPVSECTRRIFHKRVCRRIRFRL